MKNGFIDRLKTFLKLRSEDAPQMLLFDIQAAIEEIQKLRNENTGFPRQWGVYSEFMQRHGIDMVLYHHARVIGGYWTCALLAKESVRTEGMTAEIALEKAFSKYRTTAKGAPND